MRSPLLDDLAARTTGLVGEGLFKSERVIDSTQSAHIRLADGTSVINLCANNYLGLADHPDIVAAAHHALDEFGYGMASVRFICGTQTVHKDLEARLSAFLGTDDTILYSSCFDANGGLFETILDEQDAVISDALNHASIIDGIRLCRATRLRYDNSDMDQLEQRLQESADARYRLIATDGVFSMDGVLANLPAICDLAEQYDALVMVDDSHAVGLVGNHGRGTHEYADVMGRVDIITGTLGKALGGASGGYTSGRREVIDWLRQRSRPYLFSNSLAPVIASATIRVLDLLEASDELRLRVERNAARFRAGMEKSGLHTGGCRASDHPRDARRCPCRRRNGGASARRRDLRDCVLVPRRPQGQGPYPNADVGSTQRRRHRPSNRCVRSGRHRDGARVVKALVKAQPEPGLWLEDVPKPVPGDRDVLIRVRKTSICGTDLHIRHWDAWAQATIPVPMVVGHEFMGNIEQLGADVIGLEVGQRVAGEGHVTCGHCRNCKGGRREFCHNHTGVGVTRPGAFAEYVVIPAENVFVVPAHIDDNVAAVLDPLGNATHTSLRFDVVGEDVLITGAGPIGILATAIVRHIGARNVVVTDVNRFRLDMAAKHGASRVVDVRTEQLGPVMSELGMTEGFDVGLEMSGAESAFNQMLDAMNNGGRIAVLGIPAGPMTLDINDVIFKGLEIQGIYGRRIFETWYKMAAMLQSGLDVGGIITHELPADRFEEAFAIVEGGECGKVILDWA